MTMNNDISAFNPSAGTDIAPDEASRRVIRGARGLVTPVSIESDLDLTSNMIVSAGAGSGKTTALIERLITLIRFGVPVNELVAITFTKKAAGELQERFFSGLMKARDVIAKRIETGSSQEASLWSMEAERIEIAVQRSEDAFVGTIHSFCARLLRFHPVAAGIPPDFKQVDDADEQMMRKTFWYQALRENTANGNSDLALLRKMEIADEALFHLFTTCVDNAGVYFPKSGASRPSVELVFSAVKEAVRQIHPRLPITGSPDPFQLAMERVHHVIASEDPQSDLERMQLLEILDSSLTSADPPTFDIKVTKWKKNSADHGILAYEIRDGKDSFGPGKSFIDYFRDEVQPVISQWQHWLHDAALGFVTSLTESYRAHRLAQGWLTYDDLLREANRIVRDHSGVRESLQKRYSRLLVDEFQDTDPEQASLMFNLCAEELNLDDWRLNRLIPGRLFVVGDDKQSIYRFRKADFQAFSAVCSAISEQGGRHLQLSANFRSDSRVCEWVNGAVEPLFDEQTEPYQATWQPLEPSKGILHQGAAVRRLAIGKQHAGRSDMPRTVAEARAIASLIKESVLETDDLGFGDWLILVRGHSRVPAFLSVLSREGIPVALEGGKGDQVSDVVSLVHNLLRCLVDSTDHVSLVATLTSLWFGVSDADLHAFRKAGGKWDDWLIVPQEPSVVPTSIQQASQQLGRWAAWIRSHSPLSAWEKILADSGIEGALRQRVDGDVAVGMMELIGEIFARLQSEGNDMPKCERELARYRSGDRDIELFSDNVPYRDSVRIMTIHGAKGLQARRVVLADVSPNNTKKPERHIWREGPSLKGISIVKSNVGKYSRRLLEPQGWSKAAEEETRYALAEEYRLIYVAATRAIEQVTVCTHLDDGTGTWDRLIPALASESVDVCEVHPGPEDTVPGFGLRQKPLGWSSGQEYTDAGERVEALKMNTWRVLRPSEKDEDGVRTPGPKNYHERKPFNVDGRKVGTAWHTMFESLVAVRKSDVKLEGVQDMVHAVLASADVDVRSVLQDVAVGGLMDFMNSEVWKALKKADRVLTEVPFTLCRDEKGVDVLYSGIVDLAFRVGDVWTIVDYKSDSADEETILDRHASQIEAYVDAWTSLFEDRSCRGLIWSTALGRAIPVNH